MYCVNSTDIFPGATNTLQTLAVGRRSIGEATGDSLRVILIPESHPISIPELSLYNGRFRLRVVFCLIT